MPKPTRNPGVISFVGRISQSENANNSWAWVEFPYDLKELYGIGNLVPAIITFDKQSYRGSITKMGGPPMLLIKRDILAKLGKTKGDKVNITVTLDDKPREVDMPPELEKVLKENRRAKQIYDNLDYTHRKEYAAWISSAKKEETKQSRVEKAIKMILEKG